ncbi:Heterogeneous nuclear ribonucleoprotein U (hnRNP U) (Scaffold-attachment factor A) (SAF-A), partial [Durusdinium trenchii]
PHTHRPKAHERTVYGSGKMPPKADKKAAPKAAAKEVEPKKKVEPKAKPKAEPKEAPKPEAEKKRKAEEPAPEEPAAKEVKADEFEEEQDDQPDKKAKIKAEVTFLGSELTLNAVPCMGNKVLMALNEGGMQYLIAGARANVGLKGGRHMFEVKITELYHPTEAVNCRLKSMRGLVRIGFSTAGSSLILGESEGSVYFDTEGLFSAGKTKSPGKCSRFGKDQGIAIVLNLDDKSPHANTVSLFKDGQRICKPQKLPESLIGQPLFPHVSYRHASLMVNFGKTPFTKMPFVCRMVADAASVNAVVTPSPMGKDGKCELLMPVAFPDEGTFDWLDSFLEKNPQYVELSERKIMDWAIASGLPRPKNGPNASNDKPIFQYGLPSMDDQSMMRVLQSISPMTPRNYVVMEVKSNLVAEERAQILKRFPSTSFKKVARVVMGEPKEEYKTRVRNQILKVKQHKSDVTWRMKKAQQEQRKRIAEQQKLMAEKKKEFEEKKKAEEEAKKKEEEEAKAKEAEPKEGEAGEEEEEAKPEEEADTEMKDEKEAAEEEPKEEAKEETKDEEEDLGEEPPAVELTEEEEKQFFPTKGYLSDLAPSVLAKAFASFMVPEKSEGFDEVKYEWQDAAKSKEYLRKWVLETKLTTRIEELQPSQDFKDKLAAFQKSFSELLTKQKAFKTGGKKDGAKEGGFVDIFSVEDIDDIGGGEPLYSHFESEDWALLQLRYEFFLLQESFTKDVNDPDRVAIPEVHLAYYYNKYYKKQINTKQFGFTEIPDLLKLIKDTVTIDEESKMLTKVLEEADSLDMFVKCTEESRKERQRRIDAGDETARLKFQSAPVPPMPLPVPVPVATPPVPSPATPGLLKGKGKGKGKKGKWL